MTTTVSKEKIPMGIILVGIALVVIGLIAGAMMSGTNANTVNVLPDGGNSLIPGTSDDNTTSSSVTMPKDLNVFDKAYTQYLLDQVMYSVRNNPEYLEDMEKEIAFEIRGSINKKNGLIWSPEKMSLSKNKRVFSSDSIFFGLDGKINEFYSGPVIVWTQESPDSPVEYQPMFCVRTGGSFIEWSEEPYRYGVEKYSDPPPEVLKVFSDKGVTLHY